MEIWLRLSYDCYYFERISMNSGELIDTDLKIPTRLSGVLPSDQKYVIELQKNLILFQSENEIYIFESFDIKI